MTYKNKNKIYKYIRRIADKNDYALSDKEALSMTKTILEIVKEDRAKDRELSYEPDEALLMPVDKAISNNEWKIYCSDPIWIGPDFFDGQRKKGLIKSIECYQY